MRPRSTRGEMPLSAGFTLLELLVTLVILSILAAVALPSYRASVIRSHRIDAVVALSMAAQNLERYHTENNGYGGAALGDGGIYASTSPNGYYTLTLLVDRTVSLPAGASYLLTATPTGPQAGDSQCGAYTLDETGFKTANGASDRATLTTCWGGG